MEEQVPHIFISSLSQSFCPLKKKKKANRAKLQEHSWALEIQKTVGARQRLHPSSQLTNEKSKDHLALSIDLK